ncbi:MAG: 4Fe-4S binding protein [PVC group bacterium]
MLRTVLKSLFGKSACKMYPKRPATVFAATRGRISFDPSACILCTLCAKNCPPEALTVDREKYFWSIDRRRCILCGACVEKCPKNCITMENTYASPAEAPGIEQIPVSPPPPGGKQ